MRILSIDFGTTNTVAALAVDGGPARTISVDGAWSFPSAVFVAADGVVSVGRDALRQARLDPARFEPNPKRRIDDGEVLLGDRAVPVVELIAAVLRQLAAEVRRQGGGAGPDQVRLTHPAAWGAARTNVLLSAARAAGLGDDVVLIPEPVAAAAQYTRLPGRGLAAGDCIAVYDLGGGTLDVAVVARVQDDLQVLAEGGLADLGGLDFDQAILDQVGRRVSDTDPGRWQQLLRQQDLSARRAARAVAEDVKAAKETLSRHPQTDVALPDPFPDAHLTRGEFEGLIRPSLIRSVEVLQETVRRAGIAPGGLKAVFLVGGSSRIPLAAQLIQQRLGLVPAALDEPEAAVALGALLVPVPGYGQRTLQHGPATPDGAFGRPVDGQPGPAVAAAMSAPAPATPAAAVPATLAAAVPAGAPAWTRQPADPALVRRRRRRWWLGGGAVTAVLVAALVLVLVKVGGNSGPQDPAAFAADVESGMRGVHTLTATLDGGTGTQGTLRQTLTDGRLKAADLSYSVSASGQTIPITIRLAGGKAYLGSSGIASLLPSAARGRDWVLLDGSSSDQIVSTIGASLGGVLSNVGTDSYLFLLRGATSVTAGDQATIGGFATTGYQVQIDIPKAAAALPDELSAYRSLLAGTSGQATGTYWIDGEHRMVQAELTMPGSSGSQQTRLTVTRFDESFDIQQPDPSTVYSG